MYNPDYREEGLGTLGGRSSGGHHFLSRPTDSSASPLFRKNSFTDNEA